MSNQATIVPCKFEDVRTGQVFYGARVYDGYGQSYINHWDSIPDDDLEVLQMVMEAEDQIIASILFEAVMGKGVYIGNVWYEWDKIKHLWGKG